MTNSRTFNFLKNSLAIIGGLTIVGGIIIGVYLTYAFGAGNTNKYDSANSNDVKFVLNWAGLGDSRIAKINSSYESARSFTGDHLDAYDIEITHVTADELENSSMRTWFRCDILPELLDNSVEFIGGWQHEIPWFPEEQELRTQNFYVYAWSTKYHGTNCTAAQLIFINPTAKRVYYVSAKM